MRWFYRVFRWLLRVVTILLAVVGCMALFISQSELLRRALYNPEGSIAYGPAFGISMEMARDEATDALLHAGWELIDVAGELACLELDHSEEFYIEIYYYDQWPIATICLATKNELVSGMTWHIIAFEMM